MPIKIHWKSKEYLPQAFMLFGFVGLFQVLFIFIAQFFLSIGNYLVLIIIPLGAIFAIFYGSLIIFEAFAEVERSRMLKSQFRKSKIKNKFLRDFLGIPIVKPLLIITIVFTSVFFLTYFISVFFITNTLSFILAENIATITCLLISHILERSYAKVQRL